ncbi:hypothetical protein OROMI_000506 [Orobanche minor]
MKTSDFRLNYRQKEIDVSSIGREIWSHTETLDVVSKITK